MKEVKRIPTFVTMERDDRTVNEYAVKNDYENLNFPKHFFKREDKNVFVNFDDYKELKNDSDKFLKVVKDLQKSNNITLYFDCGRGLFEKEQYQALISVVDGLNKYNAGVKEDKRIPFAFVEEIRAREYRTFDYDRFKGTHEVAYNQIDSLKLDELSPLEALTKIYLQVLKTNRFEYHKLSETLDGLSPYTSIRYNQMSKAGYANIIGEYAKFYDNPNLKIERNVFTNRAIDMIYIKDEKYNVDGFYLAIPDLDKEENNSVANLLIPVEDLKAYNDDNYSKSTIYNKSKVLDLLKEADKTTYKASKPIEYDTVVEVLKNVVKDEDKIEEILNNTSKDAIKFIDPIETTNEVAKTCHDKWFEEVRPDFLVEMENEENIKTDDNVQLTEIPETEQNL